MNADRNTPNGTRVEEIHSEYPFDGPLTIVGPAPDDPGAYAVITDRWLDLHYREWEKLRIVEEEK